MCTGNTVEAWSQSLRSLHMALLSYERSSQLVLQPTRMQLGTAQGGGWLHLRVKVAVVGLVCLKLEVEMAGLEDRPRASLSSVKKSSYSLVNRVVPSATRTPSGSCGKTTPSVFAAVPLASARILYRQHFVLEGARRT